MNVLNLFFFPTHTSHISQTVTPCVCWQRPPVSFCQILKWLKLFEPVKLEWSVGQWHFMEKWGNCYWSDPYLCNRRHLLTQFELVLSGSDWHRHCWNAVRHAVSPHYQWHNTKGRCAFFSSTCQMSLKVNYAWLVFANCLMNYHEPQPNHSMYIYIVMNNMHERRIKKEREILDGHLWPPTASVESVCLPLTCWGQPHLCVPAVCILPLTYIILIIIKPPQNARNIRDPVCLPQGRT